ESEKRREKRALTLDELARLNRVSGRRWVVYLTAALTGLRRSELERLEWGDVFLDHDTPHIRLRASATKAKRADVVPINPELQEALRALRPDDVEDDEQAVQPARGDLGMAVEQDQVAAVGLLQAQVPQHGGVALGRGRDHGHAIRAGPAAQRL